MNILYIQCTSDLYGASRMLLRTVDRQIKDGHAVCVVLSEEGLLGPELLKVGASVETVPLDPTIRKKYFKSPGAVLKFIGQCSESIHVYKALCLKYSTELLYSNTSQTVTGGIIAKRLKIPHICHIRESYAGYGLFWNIYRAFLLRYSSKIVCVSDAMAAQFPARLIGAHVVTVHDGFPLNEFRPVPEERIKEFKAKYRLERFQLVGLVGRIILQRKGQDVFVKAIAELNRRYPDVRFLMIGACYPGNEFHLDNLNKLIDELGIQDSVVFTGEVADVKAAYAALDISVMASATPEPFGGVTIESMAFGKPVVGTNIGGTPEQITDGETGILIPPNDPASMAAAVARLLDDEELRVTMGRAGRRRFEKEFGFEPYYARMKKVFEEVLGTGR